MALYNNKKTIFKSAIKDNQVVIPKSLFNYNQRYKWILNDGKKTYKGSFDILDKESQEDINKEIKILTKNMTNKVTIKQIISIIYDQYSLKYDRYLVLKDI